MQTLATQTTQPSIAKGQPFYGPTIDEYLNNEAHYEAVYENREFARHEAEMDAMYAAMDELEAEKADDARIYAEQDAEREEAHRLWKASQPWYRRFMDAIRNPSHIKQVNSIH